MLISHLAYKAAQTLWTLKDPPSVIQSSNANKETNLSNAQTTRMLQANRPESQLTSTKKSKAKPP